MDQENNKGRLPCIDCITFSICKAIYIEIIKSDEEYFDISSGIEKPTTIKHIKKLVIARKRLCKRCLLLKNYSDYMIECETNFNDFHAYFHPKFNKEDYK